MLIAGSPGSLIHRGQRQYLFFVVAFVIYIYKNSLKSKRSRDPGDPPVILTKALTENYFAILDSCCAAKYSNWDRSKISAADKDEF